MKIKWRTDGITWNKIIGCLNYGYLDFLKEFEPNDNRYILDFGGGGGVMSKKLKEKSNNRIVVNIDPDISSLKSNPDGILVVAGIGQKLPFKSKIFSGVHVRAALHHAPKDIDLCLDEIYRVLDDDGIVFIQEPLNTNPLSRIARKIVPTEEHDPDEKPFNPNELLNSVSSHFGIGLVKYYFLTSYLFPHIISRVHLKRIWRGIASLLLRLDKWLLENCRFMRYYAEYIEIIGRKGVRK